MGTSVRSPIDHLQQKVHIWAHDLAINAQNWNWIYPSTQNAFGFKQSMLVTLNHLKITNIGPTTQHISQFPDGILSWLGQGYVSESAEVWVPYVDKKKKTLEVCLVLWPCSHITVKEGEKSTLLKKEDNIYLSHRFFKIISKNLLESKIRPGSNAAVAFTKPLPMSKGVAGDRFKSGLL